jgi:hypothetical protein
MQHCRSDLYMGDAMQRKIGYQYMISGGTGESMLLRGSRYWFLRSYASYHPFISYLLVSSQSLTFLFS